jgi:hypothetical protein
MQALLGTARRAFVTLFPHGSDQRQRQVCLSGCQRDSALRGGSFAFAGAQMSRRYTDDGSKIAIRLKHGVLFLDPAEVIAVEADDNHVVLVLSSGSHLVRAAICTIAETLRPCGFVQIHRSVLVNASWIQEIHPRSGEYLVCTRAGRQYPVSRTYRRNLRSLASLWIGSDVLFAEWPCKGDANPALNEVALRFGKRKQKPAVAAAIETVVGQFAGIEGP